MAMCFSAEDEAVTMPRRHCSHGCSKPSGGIELRDLLWVREVTCGVVAALEA